MSERLALFRCYSIPELEYPIGMHILDVAFQQEASGRISRRVSLRLSRRATREEVIAALRVFAARLDREEQEEQPDD